MERQRDKKPKTILCLSLVGYADVQQKQQNDQDFWQKWKQALVILLNRDTVLIILLNTDTVNLFGLMHHQSFLIISS